MCPPVLIAVAAAATVATAVSAVKSAKDAKQERRAAADEMKRNAKDARATADTSALKKRNEEYETRRVGTNRNPEVSGGSLFAPRSFFSPA